MSHESLGIVTCNDSVSPIFKNTPGATVMIDDFTKLPLSIMGHQSDVSVNKNKFYALQAVTYATGGVKYYAVASAYGRVGGKATIDEIYRGTSGEAAARAFRDKAKDKFFGLKESRAMSVMDTVASQRADEEAGRFIVDTRGLYRVNFAQVVGGNTNKPKPATTSAPPAVLPEIEKLLSFITSPENIATFSAQAALSHDIQISGKTAPMLSTVRAAKLEYSKAAAILESVRDTAKSPEIEQALFKHYSGVLKLIPMTISPGSAYARPGEFIYTQAGWDRIGKVLDLMEEAAVSATVGAIAEPNTQEAPPLPDQRVDVSDYYGLYRTCVTSGIFGAWLRPAPDSRVAKMAVASGTRALPDEIYAKLNCDIVPGNQSDYSLCWEFLKESRRTQEFCSRFPGKDPYECYAINPYTNDKKAPAFANRESVMLIHGTGMSSVAAILNGEIDIKYCSGGRLGAKRIYMADTIRKSEQYASPAGGYLEGKSVCFYFICECLLPESDKKVMNTTEDLPWKLVLSDPELLVHAIGTRSRGALSAEHRRRAGFFLGKPAYPARGYYGAGEKEIYLPAEAEIYPKDTLSSSFDYSEYVFGANEYVQPRYLVVQYLP